MATNTRSFACRLPENEGEAVEAIADEQGLMRAEVIRRAVRAYLRNNPDGCEVLA